MSGMGQFLTMKTLKQLLALFGQIINPINEGNNRLILFSAAVSSLGTDASPNDVAPDEYGCAETVWDILALAFPFKVGFPFTVSTNQMFKYLSGSPLYIQIDQPAEGDIVISPTGYGNGKLPNGHVGIKGENDTIMSNDSFSGTFGENYTLSTWKSRYVDLGGYPMVFFRRV